MLDADVLLALLQECSLPFGVMVLYLLVSGAYYD
jgi:hypothetical protein